MLVRMAPNNLAPNNLNDVNNIAVAADVDVDVVADVKADDSKECYKFCNSNDIGFDELTCFQ